MFTLEGNIYLEVKLAPQSSYAFHIEAQSIKGDVKPPLLILTVLRAMVLGRAQVEILCDSTEACAQRWFDSTL